MFLAVEKGSKIFKKLILSIDAAVGGGSIALSDHTDLIDCWVGDLKLSKVEVLIEAIADLLEKNKVSKQDIDIVFISKGIGSQTGEKIGLATAKGLCRAGNCQLTEIFVFQRLADRFQSSNAKELIIAISSPDQQVIWQRFEKTASEYKSNGITQKFSNSKFSDLLNETDEKILVKIFQTISNINSIWQNPRNNVELIFTPSIAVLMLKN